MIRKRIIHRIHLSDYTGILGGFTTSKLRVSTILLLEYNYDLTVKNVHPNRVTISKKYH